MMIGMIDGEKRMDTKQIKHKIKDFFDKTCNWLFYHPSDEDIEKIRKFYKNENIKND